MIVHKGVAYPGEHKAIADEELWDAVQARLAHNASDPSLRLRHRHPALLAGKVIDGEGRQMTSTHTKKNRKHYGYYVTRPDLVDGSRAWRVSAHDLEHLVSSEVSKKLLEPQFRLSLLGDQAEPSQLQLAVLRAETLASDLRRARLMRRPTFSKTPSTAFTFMRTGSRSHCVFLQRAPG
jgi:hypothetical protein